MEPQIILWVLMVLALAAALVAGVFLTFSDFVMPSLFAAAPAAGTEAMQIINRKVYRSIFMVLLIGLIPVSAAIAIAAFLLDLRASQWLIAAGLLYFFGVFLASAVGNIPMNKRLEAMPQGGCGGAALLAQLRHGLGALEPCPLDRSDRHRNVLPVGCNRTCRCALSVSSSTRRGRCI